MLAPKRSRYRKAHKGRVHGLAKGGTTLNFGAYGLKAADPGRITARQIEAARRAITRHIRRAGRVWIRIFPDVPVSQKPAEVRMGSGKGSSEYRARGICARRRQAASCNPSRGAPGRGGRLMNAADVRAKTDDELTEQLD